jgi:PAS domain S-box-containing protein
MADLPEPARPVRVTESQLAVLKLIAEGLTTAQIARKLHRSPRTVESHRYQLGKRFNAQNPVDLVRRAREAGILGVTAQGDHPGGDETKDVDAGTVVALLRSIDPGHSAGTGHAALASVLSGLTLGLNARAAFVRWARSADRCRAVLCWSPDGPVTSRDWDLDDCPAFGLTPGEIRSVPLSRLRGTVAEDVRDLARGGGDAVLTLHGLFESKRLAGVLGLVHAGDFQVTPAVRLVLRMVAARAGAELSVISTRERLDREEEVTRLLEAGSKAGWVRWLAESERFELSPRAAFLLGLEHARSAVPAGQVLARIHPEDRAELTGLMRDAAGHSESVVRLRTAGSPQHTLSLLAMPRKRYDTVEGGFQGLLADEARAGVACPDTLGIIQAMVSHCSDPSVVVDESGTVIAASAGWRRMIAGIEGDPSDRPYAALAAELFGREAAARIAQRVRQGANGTRPGPEQLRLTPVGTPGVEAHVDVIPLPAQRVTVVRHAFGAGAGCLSPAEPPAEASPWEHRWLLEQSSDLICTCNLEGWLRRANPAMRRVLDRSEDELRSRPVPELFVAEDREMIREQLARLAAGGRVDRLLTRMVTPAGAVRFIEWSCTPPGPGSAEFLSIGRDMTAQVVAKRRLLEARSNLDEYLADSSAAT